MVKHNVFMTGYPGFLARNLITQLIQDHEHNIKRFYLLTLPNQKEEAEQGIIDFHREYPAHKIKFIIVTGDITMPMLGLTTDVAKELKNQITHVFHLAAIYDLAVAEKLAHLVNVHGTNMVNDWVKTLPNLERYIYFSTAYVSGKREGRIYETELIKGQDFKNHYEATKYDAELLVEALKPIVPTTIIRPGIVKGNAATGETMKFDGLYFMLNLFDKLKFSPILPYLDDGEVEGNFVPADYVLKVSSYLSFAEVGIGKTYHLTDPKPYLMKDLYKMLAESYLGRTPKGKVSIRLAALPMRSKTIERWLQVERESLSYFTFDAKYDCSQAKEDLREAGITCPDLKETVEPMIDFYRKYKHDYKRQLQFK